MDDAGNSKYLPGDLIDDRYEVRKPLGQGGMAEVYLVSDTEQRNKEFALKILFSNISLDPVNIERFIREVDITQKINNPHIVKSYYYGKSKRNENFFTMEYIKGESLAQKLKQQGKIPPLEVFRYLLQILDALAAAHKAKVLHRDIKPDNIMLTEDNVIKISDFGIAKDLNTDIQLTDLEKGPKSHLYKAPELYVEDYDHRIDIYALGITTFELLTGTTPFTGERIQLIFAHAREPIPKFVTKENGIPAFFQEFVERCCAKKKEDRFGSADEALKFLQKPENYIFASYGRKAKLFLRSVALKFMISFLVGYLTYYSYVNLSSITNERLAGDSLDLVLFDTQLQRRTPLEKPNDILIIYIDEKSYAHYGYSTVAPWPREKMAELFEYLSTKSPKLIVTDFQFPKNSQTSTAEIDRRLAAAFSKNPTILSKFLNQADNRGKTVDELSYLDSDEIFRNSAKGVYNANLIADDYSDSKVRYFNTAKGTDGIPPIYQVLLDNNLCEPGYPTPYDMINYIGPPGTIDHLSFIEVLNSHANKGPGFYKDKIIFIGMQLFLSANKTQRDAFVTPISREQMAGVEIHATTAYNIIRKNWIQRLPVHYEGVALALAAIIFTNIIISVSFIVGLIFLFSYLLVWIWTSSELLVLNLFFPGMFLVITLALCALPIAALRNHLIKRADEKMLGLGK